MNRTNTILDTYNGMTFYKSENVNYADWRIIDKNHMTIAHCTSEWVIRVLWKQYKEESDEGK